MLCFMDCMLCRLAKVLYAAVRLSFSFKYSQRCYHMSPFWKLHFLSLKYRIERAFMAFLFQKFTVKP